MAKAEARKLDSAPWKPPIQPSVQVNFSGWTKQNKEAEELRAFAEQSGDAIHEAGRGFDRRRRTFREEGRIFAFLIIGYGLEIVGLGQKNAEFGTKARIVLRQAEKFRLHALMAFEHLAEGFKQEGLPRRGNWLGRRRVRRPRGDQRRA